MQIRKLLKAYLITALLLLATLSAVNWSNNLESKKISISQDKANIVIHDTSRLLVLTQEYVLFREESAAQQWQSLYADILKTLQSATGDAFPLPAETVNDVKLLRDLFHQLVSVKPEDAALKGQYERLLVGQLMTRTQALADSVKRWNDANINNRKRIEQKNIIIDIITPIMMLVILALLAFVVANRVLKPLSTLHRAVKAVAKGDLTVRSDTTTEDEFGVFSRTFDAMAIDLVTELRQEIAVRKLAEEEIKRLAALLDESQHIAHVGGWEIDLARNSLHWTDETYRIHDTSPAEYTPTVESAIGFYAPDSLPLISAAVKEAIEENKSFDLELKLITAKGRPILVHTTSKIIRENGKTVKIIGVFRDITEQRNLEEKLRQSLKMESVGRLAGGVAHELNNKLSVVLGYTTLLKLKFHDNQQVLEQLNEILKSGERARDITAQLLTFSRQQLISPSIINVAEVLKFSQLTLHSLLGEDIALSFELEDNLWHVMIDATQLNQIIMNLATNARDAMPDGGELKIVAANTTFDEAQSWQQCDASPGDYVQLTFSDSGCGMGKETLKHIFDPFYTTKGLALGTGLGLATIYGIVAQNNGFITVESEPGVGTKFRIHLPRFEEASSRAPVAVQEPTKETATILLVEDDENVRKMTTDQ